jgi:hypothetical protein
LGRNRRDEVLALPLLQRLCGEREAPGGFGVDPRGELAVGAAPVGEAGLEAQRALFGQPDSAEAGVPVGGGDLDQA